MHCHTATLSQGCGLASLVCFGCLSPLPAPFVTSCSQLPLGVFCVLTRMLHMILLPAPVVFLIPVFPICSGPNAAPMCARSEHCVRVEKSVRSRVSIRHPSALTFGTPCPFPACYLDVPSPRGMFPPHAQCLHVTALQTGRAGPCAMVLCHAGACHTSAGDRHMVCSSLGSQGLHCR